MRSVPDTRGTGGLRDIAYDGPGCSGWEVKLALKGKVENSDMDDRAVILNRGVTALACLTSEGEVL